MGVRILQDQWHEHAVMYDSVTDWAFGPVVYKKEFGPLDRDHPDPCERLEAFQRWLVVDPRTLTDVELSTKYTAWLAQEAEQYARERMATLEEYEAEGLLIVDPPSGTDNYAELAALRKRFA